MEKDLAIYYEMRAAAERVFNEGINAPAGIYSLAELSKVGTTCKTAPKGVYFREEYNADELINMNVDGFECSYPASKAFELAYKFERLAKVGAKDRVVFQRAEDHGEPVAVFTLDAVTVENSAACEDSREGFRPQMQGVFCDIAAGLSCCCDGHALNVARLADAQVMAADELENGGVILSRAFAKSAKDCKVSIYKDGENLRAVASNGASCAEVDGLYPNYKTVFSHVDESRPVQFNKNAKDLKKACEAVAKTSGCANVFLSGLNADCYITVSANGENGEFSRRVSLADPLTFNFFACCKAANMKCINGAANTLYIAQSGQIVLTGAKTLSLLSPCCFCESDLTQTAAAAYQLENPGKYNYNIFAAFSAPADSIQAVESIDNEDTLNIAPVAPADSIQAVESIDNEDTLNIAPVAPADSIQEAESIDTADTLDIAPVAPADSIQAAESIDTADTLNIASVAPADSIQAAESIDNEDTLNIAPVAPADSIQAAESIDTADTLNIAPVAPADSIQAAESIDNEDTLNIASVAPADSIQAAESIDNEDTLNIASVAPADSIQAAESIDTAHTVNLRRLMSICWRVAAMILFALFVRIGSTDHSNADTLNIASVAPADSIQAAESIDTADTLNIAPVAPADSIQAVESIDNEDTLNIASVAPADSIQASERIDNEDTLNIAPVAPDDSIQASERIDNEDTLNIAPVAPADSIQAVERIDNEDTLNIAPVAPADSIQAVESIDNEDTLNIAPVAPADSIQEAESIDTADTLDIAPVAPADSIQAAESIDTADTLNIASVAPADSIQAAESIDNEDTLNIAPVAPSDSIQAAESIDNEDTLNIASVAPADSIQAVESIENEDTLNIAPVAHSYSLYIIGLAKN